MKNIISSFFGAVIFYTRLPLPEFFPLSFSKIALWLPLIGMILAGILSIFAWIFDFIGFPPLVKSVLILSVWLGLTGALHFDGVIDTGDGFGVSGDVKKRLDVMQDSRVGAYGLISGMIVVLLKITAIYEVSLPLWWVFLVAMSWGRWGQLGVIALYPYVREEGKGAFLKKELNLPLDGFFGSLFIVILGLSEFFLLNHSLKQIFTTMIVSATISLGTGWVLQKPFAGHTGDTYGATVEWSEALILCYLTIF